MFGRRVKEASVAVNTDRCIGCERCVERCPHGVLRMRYKDDTGLAKAYYMDRCTGCGKCIRVCGEGAIELTII